MSIARELTVNQNGMTKMIEILRRNFTPDLYLREYLVNCIQAIQRQNEGNGHIIVDVNDTLEDLQKIKKISFTDNGCGMSLQDMRGFINELANSSEQKLDQENFGIGAKVSALTDNKAGIHYESWKDGKGIAILLGYDPVAKKYGLQKFDNGEDYQELDAGVKPKIIDKHGTRVTLMGHSIDQNTMNKNENISGTEEAWIYSNITRRFFKLPENIKIQIRIGHHRPKEDTRHNYLANVCGQQSALNKNSTNLGIKQVAGAKIYWWIIKDKIESHGRELLSGHTATLFEDEITNYGIGKSNLSKRFGIIFGFKNVVLLIEPNKETHQYDMGRKGVVRKDGGNLEIDKWAEEFSKNMPEKLKEYVDQHLNDCDSDDIKDIKKQLKKFMKYFNISHYQKRPDGELENVIEIGNLSGGFRGGEGNIKNPTIGPNAGKTAELLSVLEDVKKRKEKVKMEKADPWPNIIWVTNQENRNDDEEVREDGEIEDKLAEFHDSQNTIKANMDFEGYKDLMRQFSEEYEGYADPDVLNNTVIKVVRTEITKMLLQHVAYAKYLKGRNKYWKTEEFENMISSEVLTSILAQKATLIPQIKRQIQAKLGITNKQHQKEGVNDV